MRLTEGFFIIENVNDTDNGFEAVLYTNPEHPIYKAHFPGNPITPGVCIIQAAGELLEQKLGCKLYLKTIKNIKFLSVIIPEEGKKIKYSFSNIVEDENGSKAQVVVSDDSNVYAKISLIFNHERL
ncbi:MAG: beta-hydroxyacyl-ACP dehydratase [Bacteroidales bacterium]|nr:beta-hydroxyacyl-ACP dehydratase [Bacteroidales bacterium]